MKKVALVLVVLLLLAGGAAGVVYMRARQFADAPFGQKPVVVEIGKSAGPQHIAKLLSNAGAISDADGFVRTLRWFHRGAVLKAGEYEFALPMSPSQIIGKLVRGEILLHRFTVPEGLRVDEIAPIVGESGLCSEHDFLKLARSAEEAKKLGVSATSLEGYLFPDTYSMPKGIGCQGILAKMVSNARAALTQARSAGQDKKLTDAEVMTLASIIEKETGQAEERPRISCVFHNRMRIGMPLQTDPTVIYAHLLTFDFQWDGKIHRSDLDREHPYNTYKVKGLPPGPIASPGLAAMSAAVSPLTCKDLYFVSKNDHTHVFCPDLKCHSANVAKYQLGQKG